MKNPKSSTFHSINIITQVTVTIIPYCSHAKNRFLKGRRGGEGKGEENLFFNLIDMMEFGDIDRGNQLFFVDLEHRKS